METEDTQQNSNQLAVVAAQNGLDTESANNLQTAFAPLFKQAAEWKQKAASIVVTDASQTDMIKKSRESRLFIKNEIRLPAKDLHDKLKAGSLRYGRAVDGMYNIILLLTEPVEQHFEEQEKFAERQQEERNRKLQEERVALLVPYMESCVSMNNLYSMPEQEFNLLVEGAKIAKLRRDDEAKKLQEAIELKRKQELEEQERIRKENEELRKKAAEQEAKVRKEREAQEAALRKEREAREAAEREANRVRAEQEAKEKAEAEAERKRIASDKAAARKAARAPERAKLLALANAIEAFDLPVMFSQEGSDALSTIKLNIKNLVILIKDQANKL